jgi:hypothetical protein
MWIADFGNAMSNSAQREEMNRVFFVLIVTGSSRITRRNPVLRFSGRSRAISIAILISSAFVTRASAQASEPPAVDVVETTDGTIYRGITVERVPGDHLTLRLPSGESITLPWESLLSVAREAARPSTTRRDSLRPSSTPLVPRVVAVPQPRDRASARTVNVRVRAPTERTILRSQVGVLCVGSCELELEVGLTHAFDVDPGDGSGRLFPRQGRYTVITENTVGLDIFHSSGRAKRRRRWIAIAVVPVLGGILMGLSYRSGDSWCARHPDACDWETRNQPMFWSGMALALSPIMTFMIPSFTPVRPYADVVESRRR